MKNNMIIAGVPCDGKSTISQTYDTKMDYTFYRPDNELQDGCVELVEESKYIKAQCIKYKSTKL